MQGSGDGIGLDQVSARQRGPHAAQGEEKGQRAQAKPPLHIAHGAALPATVRGFFPVAHGQSLFRKAGHHAQQGGDPHPEHRARTAVKDGGGHPGDAPGADGGGQRGREGLKLGQASRSSAFPPGKQGPGSGPQPAAGLKELEKAGADRVPEPRQQEKRQEPGVPYGVAQGGKNRHITSSSWSEYCRRDRKHRRRHRGGQPP